MLEKKGPLVKDEVDDIEVKILHWIMSLFDESLYFFQTIKECLKFVNREFKFLPASYFLLWLFWIAVMTVNGFSAMGKTFHFNETRVSEFTYSLKISPLHSF